MKFQLVVQFKCEKESDFNYLIEIEDILEEAFLNQHEMDGHDIGSGEMNLFILTDDPEAAFEIVKKNIELNSNFKIDEVKAAYRELDSENYIFLWPENLSSFDVK